VRAQLMAAIRRIAVAIVFSLADGSSRLCAIGLYDPVP
jgi:hypothetical protein